MIVFALKSGKSPGPDGMSPCFFKSYWLIIGETVVKAVQHFFDSGHLLRAFNHSFIALVPKKESASRVEHFRPISLCNVVYKVITKILSTRIKPILDRLVSPAQHAFIPDRGISDNTIICQELMHHIQKKKGKMGLMAIKIDMAKAYDKVEWHLLTHILHLHVSQINLST